MFLFDFMFYIIVIYFILLLFVLIKTLKLN